MLGMLDLPEPAPLSIMALAINLVLGLILALVPGGTFGDTDRRYQIELSFPVFSLLYYLQPL